MTRPGVVVPMVFVAPLLLLMSCLTIYEFTYMHERRLNVATMLPGFDIAGVIADDREESDLYELLQRDLELVKFQERLPPKPSRSLHLITCVVGMPLPSIWKQSASHIRSTKSMSVVVRNICEQETKWKNTFMKASFARAYVEDMSSVHDDDLVVITDGSDTIFNANKNGFSAEDLASRFDASRGDKTVLLQAESYCWIGRYCSKNDTQEIYGHDHDVASCPRYLNAGAYMGTVIGLRRIFDSYFSQASCRSDQDCMTKVYKDHQKWMQLDFQGQVFSQIANPEKCALVSSDRSCGRCHDTPCRIQKTEYPNTYTKYGWNVDSGIAVRQHDLCKQHPSPMLLHGNGPGKAALLEIGSKLAAAWAAVDMP